MLVLALLADVTFESDSKLVIDIDLPAFAATRILAWVK